MHGEKEHSNGANALKEYPSDTTIRDLRAATGPHEASLRFLTASVEGDFFKGFNSIQVLLFSMHMLEPQLRLQ